MTSCPLAAAPICGSHDLATAGRGSRPKVNIARKPRFMGPNKLILAGMNAKTAKSDKGGEYVTAILYLTPADGSGTNLCPFAVIAGCKAGCLNTAGRGAFGSVQAARLRKAQWFNRDRTDFMLALWQDIAAFARYCERRGARPAVRLNGTSDIQWERIRFGDNEGALNIMECFPDVRFYDYTKIAKRCRPGALPANYELTMSYSGANAWFAAQGVEVLKAGGNLAVVWRTKAARDAAILTGWQDFPVIDGDKTDLRFTDPVNVVVGLYAKGKAKRDTSGFVVD